jgi:hypothetical protein
MTYFVVRVLESYFYMNKNDPMKIYRQQIDEKSETDLDWTSYCLIQPW